MTPGFKKTFLQKNIRSAKTLYTEGLFNITLNYLFKTPPNSSCNF